jgi:hypothetical protein
MGSLTSRPKIPSQPKTIYVPSPVLSPAPVSPVATTPAPSAQDTPQTPSADETRANNLLLRNRGLAGTVQTGFRGLLSLVNDTGNKKTLLGE